MKHNFRSYFLALAVSMVSVLIVFQSCRKDEEIKKPLPSDTTTAYKPTPYVFKLPIGWSMPPIPADNPMTVEGVSLGRKLFYDPILSADRSMACASCHSISFGFTDNGKQFSTGIDGISGTRNPMPLFNLAWATRFAPVINGKTYCFFWDGGAPDLESQVIGPITNPIEMHDSLPLVIKKLQNDPNYPALFKKAFGSDSITTKRLMQAIAQFERTLISGNSKMDKYLLNHNPAIFTAQEYRGYLVYADTSKGDCDHCHKLASPYSSDFQFHNNGHMGSDQGLQRLTGNPDDNGKFRTATLRNLVFTAPYMHDGRFQTLDEVVEFYNSQANRGYPADPFIRKHPNGLNLSDQDKADLVAFLKTFSDSSSINNPDYMKP